VTLSPRLGPMPGERAISEEQYFRLFVWCRRIGSPLRGGLSDSLPLGGVANGDSTTLEGPPKL
jgi:hypothetical protein